MWKAQNQETAAATSYAGNNHSKTQRLLLKQDQELMSLLGLQLPV